MNDPPKTVHRSTEITTAAAFYGHSRRLAGVWTIDDDNSGNILLKNCIIKTPYTYSVRLDNDAVSGLHIKTKFELNDPPKTVHRSTIKFKWR